MFKTERFSLLSVGLYLAAVVLLCGLVAREAFQTVGRPYAGILPFENLFVGAFTQSDWEGGRKNLHYHDRILSLEGYPLGQGREWHGALQSGTMAQVIILRKGEEKEFSLAVKPLPASDVFVIFAPLFATGLAFLIIGLLVLMIHPFPPGGLAFLCFCSTAGIYFLTAYDFHTTYRFVPLLMISFAFIPATVSHFALSFPRKLQPFPAARAVPYALSVLLLIPYLGWFLDQPLRWVTAEYLNTGYLSLAYLFWLGLTVYRALADPDSAIRQQCKILLIPIVFAFGATFVLAWFVLLFDLPLALNWLAPLSLVFPMAVAYAIMRRNLFLVAHLEKQVALRTEELRKTEAELHESSRLASLGTLAAGIAHEIGNSMHLILSNIPVLKRYTSSLANVAEGTASPEGEDYEFMRRDLPELLANLEKGADRAMEISGDLKTFARPAGTARAATNLSELLETVLKLLKHELKDRITVKKKIDKIPLVPVTVSQIHHAYLNLLLNAIQSMEGTGEIEVEIRHEKDQVITSIRDSGRGMTEEELGRAQEPFFSTKESGTGLGLSVVQGIAKAHGGSFRIESRVDQGTVAELILPVQPERV